MSSYATLAQLRTHTGMPAAGQDELLQALLDAATGWIDGFTNSTFVQATATDEAYDGTGSRSILLRHRPVIEVTAVTVSGAVWSSELWTVNNLGWLVAVDNFDISNPRLYRRDDCEQQCGWPPGTQNIKVTYSYGYTSVPAAVATACAMLAAHWYRTDRRQDAKSVSYGPISKTFGETTGVPPTILTLLSRFIQTQVGY